MSTRMDKFMARVGIPLEARYPERACWRWRGVLNEAGYGKFYVGNRKMEYAHRWSYRAFQEEIPEGKEIHHTCKNKWCVNPEHLVAVSRKEHVDEDQRDVGGKRAVTHCPQGHPYDEDNTYLVPGRNHRLCRECRRQRNRERERQRRATERSQRESNA